MTFPALRAVSFTVLFIATATMVPLQPADAASTKERLESVERKLDSNSRGLLNMLNRVEQLQRDIQQLRGEIELQTHTQKDAQRRSREQYMDIDRRLQQLESAAGMQPPAPPVATPPAVTAPDPLDPPPMTRPPGCPTPQMV